MDHQMPGAVASPRGGKQQFGQRNQNAILRNPAHGATNDRFTMQVVIPEEVNAPAAELSSHEGAIFIDNEVRTGGKKIGNWQIGYQER